MAAFDMAGTVMGVTVTAGSDTAATVLAITVMAGRSPGHPRRQYATPDGPDFAPAIKAPPCETERP